MRFLLALLFVGALALPAIASADSPTHVVAYGETLYSIARRYGITPQALASANGITTSSWVYAGQRLQIPGASDTAGTSSGSQVSVAQASPSGIYTVRAGDTLFSLSRAFGVSVAALADANDIPPNGILYTGWQLKIPGKTSSSNSPNPPDIAPAKPVSSVSQPSNVTTTYIVQPGDTLFAISLKNNVTVMALRLANNLSTVFVYSGQRLIIPNSASASTVTATAASAPAAGDSVPSSSAANNASVSPRIDVEVDNIPLYRQEQTLTCEEAAAAMALRGAVSEAQIVAAMPRSDNPFQGIRGSTNFELIGGLTHYGTYAQGLQKGLAALGHASTAYYGQPYEKFQASIIETLKQGRPVIWWTTWRESQQRPQWVDLGNGIKIPLTPYEHAVVIVAANDQGVTYHDPYDATVRFTTWANHQRASSYFNNMALVIF